MQVGVKDKAQGGAGFGQGWPLQQRLRRGFLFIAFPCSLAIQFQSKHCDVYDRLLGVLG